MWPAVVRLVGLAVVLRDGSGTKGAAVGLSSSEGWVCCVPVKGASAAGRDGGAVGSCVVDVGVRLEAARCLMSLALQLGFGSVVGGDEWISHAASMSMGWIRLVVMRGRVLYHALGGGGGGGREVGRSCFDDGGSLGRVCGGSVGCDWRKSVVRGGGRVVVVGLSSVSWENNACISCRSSSVSEVACVVVVVVGALVGR
jgi:hypothetical protein